MQQALTWSRWTVRGLALGGGALLRWGPLGRRRAGGGWHVCSVSLGWPRVLHRWLRGCACRQRD